jgi:SAM-dependent methyltransferase
MMKLPFMLRKPERDEPLVVAMTGARLGSRVVFAGTTPDLFAPLAQRVGLSGQFTVVSDDAEPIRTAAERDGLVLDTATELPLTGDFDLAVVEAVGGWREVLSAVRRALRPGGRLVVIAGRPAAGLFGRFRSTPAPDTATLVAAMLGAGWPHARGIGEQESMRFAEAVNS